MNKKVKIPLFKEFGKDKTAEFLEFKFHQVFNGLIGNNILIPLDAILDFKNRRLIVDEKEIPIFFNKEEEFTNETYPKHVPKLEIYYTEMNKEPIKNQIRIDHLNKEEKDIISKLVSQYSSIFYQEGSDLSFTNAIKHNIKTVNDIPIYTKNYRYPEVHRNEVNSQIKEMLNQGIIRPSDSPYSAPIWIVPKKKDASGRQKWRIVIDYRKLNEVSVDDKFPIPNMEDIFDKLGKSMYFTTLDLAKGFHQIEIAEEDIRKTAFSTDKGHYEFVRMPFGLKNAPATFQRLMNSVLNEFIGKICLVYLDDIIIFSTSLEEHIISLTKIFKRLKEVNLKVQLDKSEFLRKETEFLGHVVTTEGIKPNPNKIAAIQNYKLPRSTKQIKAFLGITGYYRKFIKDYGKVAKPMTAFLKKNAKIDLNDKDYIESFENLKTLITSAPVLRYPDFEKKFTLTTDASNYAIGGVLSQENHPICYYSRTLNEHEIRYSTIEKELLAIVQASKYFRSYLYGRKFIVRTDHRPLVWLSSLREPNAKLQRWKIKLEEYNFDIEYVKGKDNQVADGLSRMEVYFNENSEIRNNQESLDNNSSNENIPDNQSLLATIHSADEDNSDYIPIVESPVNIYKTQIILNTTENASNHKIYSQFGKKRIVINLKTFKENLILDIMKQFIPPKGIVGIYSRHDHLFAQFQNTYIKYFSKNKLLRVVKCSKFLGDLEDEEKLAMVITKTHKLLNHRGINETFAEIRDVYYAPKLKEKIQQYINNCEICNKSKYERLPHKIPLKLTETPTKPNQILHIDIWYANINLMYVTIIDKFTKHVTVHEIRHRTWLSLLNTLRHRFSSLGIPNRIITDGETGFSSILIKEFLKENNVDLHITTPYHKTGNSDIERFHSTLNEHIRTFTADDNNKDTLRNKVLKAVTIYNQTIHSTTNRRPIDFLNGSISNEDYPNITEQVKKKKERYINKCNRNKNDVDLTKTNHLYLKNRNNNKLKPIHKKENVEIIDKDHIKDSKGSKFYKKQVKRTYKYENT